MDLVRKQYPNSAVALDKSKPIKGKSHIVSGLYADIYAIKKGAAWRPKTKITDGVKKMVEYLKKA